MARTRSASLTHAHATCMEHLDRLESAARAQNTTPAELHQHLEQVRGCLTEYLRLEEQGGYLHDVLPPEPGPHRAAGGLRVEHRKLAGTLDALTLEAARPEADAAALRAQVVTWIEEFRQHEERENLLVEEALIPDVGAGD